MNRNYASHNGIDYIASTNNICARHNHWIMYPGHKRNSSTHFLKFLFGFFFVVFFNLNVMSKKMFPKNVESFEEKKMFAGEKYI